MGSAYILRPQFQHGPAQLSSSVEACLVGFRCNKLLITVQTNSRPKAVRYCLPPNAVQLATPGNGQQVRRSALLLPATVQLLQ